jgi:hypothetical protein
MDSAELSSGEESSVIRLEGLHPFALRESVRSLTSQRSGFLGSSRDDMSRDTKVTTDSKDSFKESSTKHTRRTKVTSTTGTTDAKESSKDNKDTTGTRHTRHTRHAKDDKGKQPERRERRKHRGKDKDKEKENDPKKEEKEEKEEGKEETGTCTICFEDSTLFSLSRCKHSFCADCLEAYLEGNITEHALPLICPERDCETEIPNEDVKKLVKEGMGSLLDGSLILLLCPI